MGNCAKCSKESPIIEPNEIIVINKKEKKAAPTLKSVLENDLYKKRAQMMKKDSIKSVKSEDAYQNVSLKMARIKSTEFSVRTLQHIKDNYGLH